MNQTFQQCLSAVAALALLAGSGLAEAKEPKSGKPAPSAAKTGVGEGDTEFGVFANYTTFDDIDSDTLLLGASIGRFLSDSLELRVTPVISFTDSSGLSMFNLSPYVTVEYLFRNASPVWPYVGGGIGINVGFGSGTGVDIFDFSVFGTPVAGLKFFVSERMALEYALGFQVGVGTSCVDTATTSDCYDSTTEAINNTLRFNIYY